WRLGALEPARRLCEDILSSVDDASDTEVTVATGLLAAIEFEAGEIERALAREREMLTTAAYPWLKTSASWLQYAQHLKRIGLPSTEATDSALRAADREGLEAQLAVAIARARSGDEGATPEVTEQAGLRIARRGDFENDASIRIDMVEGLGAIYLSEALSRYK